MVIGGENAGPGALKNAETFVITDQQFESFVQKHKAVKQLVPESNAKMKDSYLILDERVSCEYTMCLTLSQHHANPPQTVTNIMIVH